MPPRAGTRVRRCNEFEWSLLGYYTGTGCNFTSLALETPPPGLGPIRAQWQ